jgi:hypothetical protein
MANLNRNAKQIRPLSGGFSAFIILKELTLNNLSGVPALPDRPILPP